jgi:Fe-S cluster assembly protein SufD
VPAFTPDAAREFSDTFVDERVAAAERFAAAEMPTTAEEIWRYSRVDELDLDRYHPAPTTTTISGADGLLTDKYDVVSATLGVAPDVFAELNTAFMTPTALRIPDGQVVAGPIVVEHTVTDAGSAVFPRLVIDVGSDAEVTVIERFTSPDGVPVFLVPSVQIHTGQAARVKYLAINELGDRAWQIGHQQAIARRDSSLLLATVALGGEYARVRTEARAAGQGASTRQIALYFAGDEQMHDFRTIQDHDAPHATSDLLFKGAVQDKARSVYTGLIKVRHHAKGTNAFQTNRTLTLSEGSWAESVPNLDIETNDVRCSHASTVGPIDEEQRFYLESRGIPDDVAERLIVLGFFDEVLDQLPATESTADLRRRVADKLTIAANAGAGR